MLSLQTYKCINTDEVLFSGNKPTNNDAEYKILTGDSTSPLKSQDQLLLSF